MPHLPNPTLIYGVRYSVEEKSLKKNDGLSCATKKTIEINSKLSHDTAVETYYHEVVHQMIYTLGWDKLVTEQIEEMVCQAMGLMLADFITHNEALPKYKDR